MFCLINDHTDNIRLLCAEAERVGNHKGPGCLSHPDVPYRKYDFRRCYASMYVGQVCQMLLDHSVFRFFERCEHQAINDIRRRWVCPCECVFHFVLLCAVTQYAAPVSAFTGCDSKGCRAGYRYGQRLDIVDYAPVIVEEIRFV